jgi:hypothetical protein
LFQPGESAAALFYRFAPGLLPAGWFREVDPATVTKARRSGRLKLEIVSHCWRYGHLLTYQLSSLVQHRCEDLDLTMTVFHAPGDESVARVLEYFGGLALPGITWNWQALPREQLFRRSIGRNLAARATTADWIWFTDADILFHEGCLARLAGQLQGRDDALVYPATTLATALLPEDDPILARGRAGPALLDIPLDALRPFGGEYTRAKGAYQIVHGDIARACGYCGTIPHYQSPAQKWMKTYEDRAFRWLIDTQGVPIEIPNVCQIRHLAKGRYKSGSSVSTLRGRIRQSRDP